MGHIQGTIVYVFTDRMQQMREYYRTSLGVEPSDGGPDWCSFDLGGGKQLALHGQLKQRAETRPFHLTLTTSDIEGAVADFRREGDEPDPR